MTDLLSQWIADNDAAEIAEVLREKFNCQTADFTPDGLWIADPQAAHYLSDAELADLERWLVATGRVLTTPICPKHNIPLIYYCPACRGEQSSDAKAQAARENGKRGGRPKKRPKP